MTKSSMQRRAGKLDKAAVALRKQSQVTAPVLPLGGHLPPDTPDLFTTADVQAALEQFELTRKEGGDLEAMRAVMMLSLAVASVNLGVAPQQQ